MSSKLSSDTIDQNTDVFNQIIRDNGNGFEAIVRIKYDDFCPPHNFETYITISNNNMYMALNMSLSGYEDKFYETYSSNYQIFKYVNSIIVIDAKDKQGIDIEIDIIPIS